MKYLKNKNRCSFVLLLILIVSLVNILQFKWWWFSSLSENNEWYPALGFFTWIFKWLYILALIILFLYLLKSYYFKLVTPFITKYIVFILFVVLGLTLKNQHPFSNLAVYSNFPDKSYLYVIEDETGNVFNHGLEYKSADIVDLYDSFLAKNKLSEPLSESNRNRIGKRILDFERKRMKIKSKKCFKVIQQVNYFHSTKIKSNKVLLYDECN